MRRGQKEGTRRVQRIRLYSAAAFEYHCQNDHQHHYGHSGNENPQGADAGIRVQISGIEDIAAHFFGVGRRGVFHCLRDFIILINTVADGKTFRCQLFLLFFRAFQP